MTVLFEECFVNCVLVALRTLSVQMHHILIWTLLQVQEENPAAWVRMDLFVNSV